MSDEEKRDIMADFELAAAKDAVVAAAERFVDTSLDDPFGYGESALADAVAAYRKAREEGR